MFSCEEQMVIIPDAPTVQEPDTTGELKRIVLLEELTGVSCPPCFDGAEAVKGILQLFPGRVVVNGIHGAFQAAPTTGSTYDFRNADALALENSFFFLGKPSAVIDRIHFEDQEFLTIDVIDLWRSKVQDRLDVPVKVKLEATSDYDENNRRASITVTVEAEEEVTGIVKIHVLINENHLIDSQEKLNSPTVLDFDHKHVMKDMLTNVQGDLLSEGLMEGEAISVNYTFTVPPEELGEWNPENLDVLFYLTSNDADDEVLQAGAISIK